MKGQGGGGTARGGGKFRSGGETVTIKKSKSMQTKAIDGSVVKLRAALFDEQGRDKDVTEGVAKSFLSYERNGIAVEISFSPKLSSRELSWAFDLVKDNMEDVYDNSGYGWDDDDKERELKEQGARFLLLKEKESHKLIGFVHFRFTVQGEVIDQMIGAPCVYILDLHVEEAYQKKGLGRHLLIILELIGRREQMSRVSLPVFLHDEEMKEWITTKCRGYTLDTSYHEIGFDADGEGFEVYSKIFTAPNPTPRPAVTTATTTTITSSSNLPTPSPITATSDAAAAPPVSPSDDTTAGTAAGQGEGEEGEEEEESVTVSIEEVIAQLKECYIQEHDGTAPSEEVIAQWTEEVRRLQDTAESLTLEAAP